MLNPDHQSARKPGSKPSEQATKTPPQAPLADPQEAPPGAGETGAGAGISAACDQVLGVTIARRNTSSGVHPFDEVEWETRSAQIANERGEMVFEQLGVEVPRSWSQMATNIVVSKYFRGTIGTPERERSVRQLIGRVVGTIAGWGRSQGYFATGEDADIFEAELAHLLLHQKVAFNSPVWFNVGIEPHPQASACFINSVQDTMQSILELAKTEGMLFKYGSGTGSNLSTIRSSRELLAGGGTASGPVSFMKGYDAFAGVIKSGGKTRRAAKMVILNADHPDVMDFIWCKATEERKAHALIEAGYDPRFNVQGGAYDSVFFQNANHSVRVTDEFMRAVVEDSEWKTRAVTDRRPMQTFKARELMRAMAEAAWQCGDPGLQYDSTTNDWHTCPNSGRINASNPCVTGDTLVATSEGWRRIDSLVGETAEVIGADGQLHPVSRIFSTGNKTVHSLKTRAGYEVRITADHKVWTEERGDVAVSDLRAGDHVALRGPEFGRDGLEERLGLAIGVAVGDGCLSRSRRGQETVTLVMAGEEAPILETIANVLNERKHELRPAGMVGRADDVHVRVGVSAVTAVGGRSTADETLSVEESVPAHAVVWQAVGEARAAGDGSGSTMESGARQVARLAFASRSVVDVFKTYAVLDEGSHRKRFTPAVHRLDRSSMAAVLRGLFTADGTVANYGDKSQYVSLDSSSRELLSQVQLLLLAFGIKSKLYGNRRGGASVAVLPDGRGGSRPYPVREMHSLRISRSSRAVFEREIGFDPASPKTKALRELNGRFAVYQGVLTDAVESIEPLGVEEVFDLTEEATQHFVANGIVVHNCSEYVFLDDTACNLASLNLMKFRRSDGEFDVEGFRHAVRITILGQEILVGNASYPTPAIGKNSHEYRPLGLGYANLGALLMSRGVTYDSDAGRATAAAITALMCGEAYAESARVAGAMGPFAGYEKNAEPFLRVMEKHRAAADAIPDDLAPTDLLAAARRAWAEVVTEGRKHGFKNAQSTVLAPTGTIAFMMDCDTTGIEPDISLIKYKKLVGGGLLKIVNNTVPLALNKLGYDRTQIQAICDYLNEHETIEGAPGLADEHLPIFDCAFKPKNGERSIHYSGHLKMMTSVQPFLSGAISKTVNLPEEATVEDIENAYIEGWRGGLKAVAIYRDGCKKSQPLSTGKDADTPKAEGGRTATAAPAVSGQTTSSTTGAAGVDAPMSALRDEARGGESKVPLTGKHAAAGAVPAARPFRRRLPDERHSITHKFSIGGHEGYITVGMFEDGQPGEIFVTMAKTGSVVSGLMDSFATAISMTLQYGVPLRVLCDKFSHTRFEPSGITNNADIRFAKSIIDYIFRWLALKFLPSDQTAKYTTGISDEAALEPNGLGEAPNGDAAAIAARHAKTVASGTLGTLEEQEKRIYSAHADAPPCNECGEIMIRNGSCYACINCGSTSGCS